MNKHVFVIIPADTCNLSCSFCCVGKCEGSSTTMMTIENATKYSDIIVRYIIKHNIKHIEFMFFGGEPLLNFDAVKIFLQAVSDSNKKYGIPKLIDITMFTNGTVNTPEYIKLIDTLNKNRPIFKNEIQFSYDGPTHLVSRISEKTNLDFMKNAIKLIGDNEYHDVKCMIVVSNHNVNNFFELFKFLHKEGILNYIIFRIDIENSNYARLGGILLPQLQLIVDYIKKNPEIYNGKIISRLFGRYLDDGSLSVCMSGTRAVGISANGVLCGCHHDAVTINNRLFKRSYPKLKSVEDIENYTDLSFAEDWYQIGKDGHAEYEDICPAHYEKVKDDQDRKEFFRKVHEIVKQLDEEDKNEEEK